MNKILYETIFTRRSVRKYSPTPLDSAILSEVKHALDRSERLFGLSPRFEIANADKLKGCAAPHAILAYGDDGDKSMIGIGYTLQEIDLYLQSVGYGSLWSGMARPVDKAPDYRILLAFGNTDVPARTGETDFKRKKLLDISNYDNEVAHAARVAPSAVNFQPWRLTFEKGRVTAASEVRGFGKLLGGKTHLIDLGIVLKHIEIALIHQGCELTEIKPIGDGKNFAVEVYYSQR